MRIDFEDRYPKIKFILDPVELDFVSETGKSIPVDSVEVDFRQNYIVYRSLANIQASEDELSDTSKQVIAEHVKDLVYVRLGIPKSGSGSRKMFMSGKLIRHVDDPENDRHGGCSLYIKFF